jgi:hypothetical protein
MNESLFQLLGLWPVRVLNPRLSCQKRTSRNILCFKDFLTLRKALIFYIVANVRILPDELGRHCIQKAPQAYFDLITQDFL